MRRPRGARAAYLAQEYAGDPERSVLAEVMAAAVSVAEIAAKIAAAEARLGDPAVAGDMRAAEGLRAVTSVLAPVTAILEAVDLRLRAGNVGLRAVASVLGSARRARTARNESDA